MKEVKLYNIYWYDSYGNKSLIDTTNDLDKWLEENNEQRIVNGEKSESLNDFEIEEVETIIYSEEVTEWIKISTKYYHQKNLIRE